MRKILSAVLLFLLLFFAAGCDSAPVEVPPSPPPYAIDFVLPQTDLDKNSVFLDVYYGRLGDSTIDENSTIRLFFNRADPPAEFEDEEPFLIKEIPAEKFNSDIYVWKGFDGYCDTIQIPEELLNLQEGTLVLSLLTFHPEENYYSDSIGRAIDYKIQENHVTLSKR